MEEAKLIGFFMVSLRSLREVPPDESGRAHILERTSLQRAFRFLQCATLALPFAWVAIPARAYDAVEQTSLVNIKHGSPLSQHVYKLGVGSYELSGGGVVDFRRWYKQTWTEMRADFMTQITEGSGVLWGVSTGESGAKYRIAPGFKLGFILQAQPTPMSFISISFTTLLGGRLREKSCVADYGDIGGVQDVNCRLAASQMAPADTLKYLVNMKPPDRMWVGLRYQARF